MADDIEEQLATYRSVRALVCLLFLTFAMTSDAVGSVVSRVISALHLSRTAAGAFQYVPMGAMAAGAVGLGYLADRLGRKPAILALGTWLLPTSSLAMSVVYPTLNSRGISCLPRSEQGAAAGVLLFFTAAAAALGQLAMAAVLALLMCIALLLNWLIDPTRQRLEAVGPQFEFSGFGAGLTA